MLGIQQPDLSFLAGNSDMSARMRAKDWAVTPLESPARWPQALKSVVRIMLTSRYAMWLGWGPQLTFLYNDAYAAMTLGAKHPWALGRPAQEVWAEIWPQIGPRIDKVLGSGEATWDERLLLFLERSGYLEETYHTFSYSPLADDSGAICGQLCVVTEVTERVIGERRLALLRELAIQLATESTTAGVYGAVERSLEERGEDLPFTLTYTFDGTAEHSRIVSHTGISPEFTPVILLSARAGEESRVEGMNAGADDYLVKPFSARELRARVSAQLQMSRARSQMTKRMLAIEREAREAAEMASRTKDEFLAVVSHELRTPLNAILGWSRMLRSGRLGDGAMNDALETIERNAKTQAQLIEDLLDVSRIVTGQLRLDVQSVSLVSVIQAAADSVRPAADAKQLRLQMILDPLAGPVAGDPVRLQQVVWNLLSNAIKFTEKGGRIQVRLERVNSYLELVVSDSGKGIAPDFLPFVFERFRQADSTLTRSAGGLGLGLAIVRHLVELHGGSVDAYSRGNGQGATFTIKLPLMPLRANEPQPEIGRKHPSAEIDEPFECPKELVGLRVLVIDDEPDARTLLLTILSQCKAEVRAVESAEQARDALVPFKPDVILSDIEMPEEDGYVFMRRLRASEGPSFRLPSAALTAHASMNDRMRALSAGYDIHVPKPIEPAELLTVVVSLANRARRA